MIRRGRGQDRDEDTVYISTGSEIVDNYHIRRECNGLQEATDIRAVDRSEVPDSAAKCDFCSGVSANLSEIGRRAVRGGPEIDGGDAE